ncbi:hypothetical protein BCR44DRAFT_1265904 [Catenaria anguillulae PL171]|uniref:Uncharacterized protein n=1 Tax=Catenaria anguillulae PL171 TaxID=765915 RepID=A0A1Y2HEK1_9FUNG|nr:hypothetical protein BCR44DRAFT_1265904 [Catenaria anguillulae PL171]
MPFATMMMHTSSPSIRGACPSCCPEPAAAASISRSRRIRSTTSVRLGWITICPGTCPPQSHRDGSCQKNTGHCRGSWPPRLLLMVFSALLVAATLSTQTAARPNDRPPMPQMQFLPSSGDSLSAALQLSSVSPAPVTPSPWFQQSRDDSCVPLNLDLCRYDWAASSDPSTSSSSSSSSLSSPANPNPNNNLPSTSGRRPQEASPPGGAFQINGPPSFITVRKSAWSQQLPKQQSITDILARISPSLKQHATDANSTLYAPLRYFQSLTCLELAFTANNATLDPVICPLASVTGRSSPVAQQQARPQPSACPMNGVSALRTTFMCTMYATSVRDTLLLADGAGSRLPADWLDTAVYSVFPRVCPKALNLDKCSDVDFVPASMPLALRDPISSPLTSSPAWWNTTATNALQMLVGKAIDDAGPLAVSEEAEGCGLSAQRTRKLVAEAAARASAGAPVDSTTHDDAALNQRRGGGGGGGNGLGNSAAPGAPAASYSFTYAQEAEVQAKLCVFGCKTDYCTQPLPVHAWPIGAIVGLVLGLAFLVLIILAATVPRCDRKVGGEDDLAVHERAAFRFWLGFLWLENAFRRCRRSRKEAVATPSEGGGIVTKVGEGCKSGLGDSRPGARRPRRRIW